MCDSRFHRGCEYGAKQHARSLNRPVGVALRARAVKHRSSHCADIVVMATLRCCKPVARVHVRFGFSRRVLQAFRIDPSRSSASERSGVVGSRDWRQEATPLKLGSSQASTLGWRALSPYLLGARHRSAGAFRQLGVALWQKHLIRSARRIGTRSRHGTISRRASSVIAAQTEQVGNQVPPLIRTGVEPARARADSSKRNAQSDTPNELLMQTCR